MFEDFDFDVLDDPNYKEDAVREDLISPLLKALGYLPSGKQRMQRSQSLVHPFVKIGSQKRKIHIIPDYTLWYENQAVLILDAKNPSEPIINSEHAEQAFSYAIHPDIRTKSYALCNGWELILYDIDCLEPVFRVQMKDIGRLWLEVLTHLSPEALIDHHHRRFQPDLGIFLKNAGFSESHTITFTNSRIISLGRTLDGGLTAIACYEMVDGMGFQGSFDMPVDLLPHILSCLPEVASSLANNALQASACNVFVGGVIEIVWDVQLGEETVGRYAHDPFIPLIVRVIRRISRAEPLGPTPDDIPNTVLNLPVILTHIG